MNLKGKVNQIQANGTFESKFGKMFKYELSIESEQGQKNGQYASKKYETIEQLPFNQGDEVYFEFIDGEWPKIKSPSKNPPESYPSTSNAPKSNDKVQGLIVRQNVLQRAMEYMTHHSQTFTPEEATVIAEKFETWVNR